MQRHDADRIAHILNYCTDISAVIERFGRDYQTFVVDKDYHDVVAFRILQIGELAGNLSEELRSETAADMNWQQIKAMRNIVAHHYGSIQLEIVWNTVKSDVPELMAFCRKQLDDFRE